MPRINSQTKRAFATGVVWLLAFVAWFTVPVPIPNVENLTVIGASEYRPDFDVIIYLVSGIAAVIVGTLLTYLAREKVRSELPACTGVDRMVSRTVDCLAILTVLCLVPVIAPDVLAEQTFNGDQFHHLDFYLMGPLNAFRHGASLGTEVYTQYGSGWILIFLRFSVSCSPSTTRS